MKIAKPLLGLLVALVVIIAVFATIGLNNLNQLIKVAVETAGSEATQTAVTLNKADITLSEGKGELLGLTVANPEGYNSDYVFSMDRVAIEIDTSSVTENVLVIRDITIDGAALIAEIKENTDSNLQEILDTLKAGSANQSNTDANSTYEGSDVRLMAERVRILNTSARIILAQEGEKTLTLPDIDLKDIGDKTQGLTPEQLSQALIKPIVDQARKQVNKALKAEATNRLKEKLAEKLSDEDNQKLDKLKSLFGK